MIETMPTLDDIETFIKISGSDSLSVFGGSFEGGIHCQQVPDEMAACIYAILESGHPIKTYLEIGVASGGTTYLFNHYFSPELIVLIDDNKHHKAVLRAGVLQGIKYQEIIGRSDDEAVLRTITDMETLFDVILIDGDHNYPSVKLDSMLYSPFLNEDGFLILHDSALPHLGIMQVVKELKADNNLIFVDEYISKKYQPFGIALFRIMKQGEVLVC